jgi:diadenosine tetraphosphate (Ap4A) HIT family hydrolase
MVDIVCPFCSLTKERVVLSNKLWFAAWDKYPVNKGHILIIPFRHISSYFDTTDEEKIALLAMIEKCKELLDEKFQPDGYNIGINIGQAAGQTVMHLHIHIIPRYSGDMDKPHGGVRGVIPNKRIY